MSVLEFELLMEVMLGDEAAKGVKKQYPFPKPEPKDARPVASVVTTASIFKCANRNVSRVLAASAGRTAPIFACAYVPA